MILGFSKYEYVEHLKRAKAYEILGYRGGLFDLKNDAQKVRHLKTGGEKGIRTPDTVKRIHDFQSCAFDHSATSPYLTIVSFEAVVRQDGVLYFFLVSCVLTL